MFGGLFGMGGRFFDDYDDEDESYWGHDSVEPDCDSKESDPVDKVLADRTADGESFMTEFDDAISRLDSPGDFSTGGKTQFVGLPGLQIEGLGLVSVPITERDIPALTEVFIQAPFGHGEETIVDREVRDTLQLDPRHFSVTNPAWEDVMKTIVNEAKLKLGCADVEVVANLYKLLLYRPGGHFKPHQDTEKEDGMFGTLVVQLPSDYEGGTSVIEHQGHTHTYDFSVNAGSVFHTFYTCWYADCMHEIKPITRGNRLCLVYNLCAKKRTAGLSAEAVCGQAQVFSDLLASWESDPAKLGVVLSHAYTEDGLKGRGVEGLKGKDMGLYQAIEHANSTQDEEHQCDMYLVLGERVVEDSGDGYRGYFSACGDREEHFSLMRLFDTAGAPIPATFRLHREDLLPFHAFTDRKADKQNVEYTGNEGATRTRLYHTWILVLIPKRHKLQARVEAGDKTVWKDFEALIERGDVSEDTLRHHALSIVRAAKSSSELESLVRKVLKVVYNKKLWAIAADLWSAIVNYEIYCSPAFDLKHVTLYERWLQVDKEESCDEETRTDIMTFVRAVLKQRAGSWAQSCSALITRLLELNLWQEVLIIIERLSVANFAVSRYSSTPSLSLFSTLCKATETMNSNAELQAKALDALRVIVQKQLTAKRLTTTLLCLVALADGLAQTDATCREFFTPFATEAMALAHKGLQTITTAGRDYYSMSNNDDWCSKHDATRWLPSVFNLMRHRDLCGDAAQASFDACIQLLLSSKATFQMFLPELMYNLKQPEYMNMKEHVSAIMATHAQRFQQLIADNPIVTTAPPPVQLTCRCELCLPVQQFLMKAEIAEYRLRAKEQVRKHVEKTLRASKVPVEWHTVRHGSPLTLLISNRRFDDTRQRKDIEAFYAQVNEVEVFFGLPPTPISAAGSAAATARKAAPAAAPTPTPTPDASTPVPMAVAATTPAATSGAKRASEGTSSRSSLSADKNTSSDQANKRAKLVDLTNLV